MNRIAARLIALYQKYISPYKGFHCAAGAYYGTATCSQAVKEIIQEDGIVGGRAKVRQQFQLCAAAARTIQEQKKKKPKERRREADATCWLAEAACWGCAFWQ